MQQLIIVNFRLKLHISILSVFSLSPAVGMGGGVKIEIRRVFVAENYTV